MPLISVIVPVYNTEKYLHRCIDSILAQTFTDFELLLIDDGSKDNSGKICDESAAKDSRVRVFHKDNGGASSARYMGLNNAKGKWITFVDSDDSIRLDTLEMLLIHSLDENIDAVIANTEQDKVISGEEWAKLLLNCKTRCELWGGLYKRSLFNKMRVHVPSTIVIGEDFLLNLQYAINSLNARLLSDMIYNYTQEVSTSLVHSYRLTLEHEKKLLQCMDVILRDRETVFAYEIFRKRYLTLERLIFIGKKTYSEEWVKELMKDKKKYRESLGLKEIVLLSVPCAKFCRFVLKVGMFLKAHFLLNRKYG